MEPLAARAQLRILRIFGSGTPPAFPLRPLDPDGLQEARDACELLKDCFYTIQFIQTMLIKKTIHKLPTSPLLCRHLATRGGLNTA